MSQYLDSSVFYLDAGTGSMLAQMAVAGVAGVAVAFKVGWARVTSPFRRKRPEDAVEPEKQHSTTDD
jgi:hypothetical protein